jgi:hypothetical protein
MHIPDSEPIFGAVEDRAQKVFFNRTYVSTFSNFFMLPRVGSTRGTNILDLKFCFI